MYRSYTYGEVDLRSIPEKLNDYFQKAKKFESPIRIVVGTDSQNFSDTKMVTVIAIYCEGHGGIYFYEVSRISKIKDVRVKLHTETGESLRVATELIDGMEKYDEMFMNVSFSIHIDAGFNPSGKTRELIPELVGWIKSCGYDCECKPDSWVASTVADRISK